MSEEFQQVLFSEFSREDENSEKDPQGTGLGLVIVKRMVEKLGGKITFESQQNAGSRFHIRLPLRVVKD
jgi:signal transduction histidine kinase